MKKYWAIFKTQLANRLAYPADLITSSLSILVYLWIFLQLWRATYSASGQSSIAGLSLSDTLWYLMMTEAIILSKPRLSRGISDAVKDGSIAYLLNKPYNFLYYQLSTGLADGFTRLFSHILIGGGLVWLLVGPPPDPRGWPFVLVSIFFSLLIDFCFQALIGLSAFVAEEVSAFDWIYQKLLFILGGMLIPLDFFPGWLRSISQATPFAYTIYGPARLFVSPDLTRFATLLVGQAIWLAIMAFITGLAFRRGMQWLTINGG
jgi:ABC-2 type transport system permease protein